jgi:beta-glucosidase
VDIANTGSRAGEEVAQLYVAAPGKVVPRAPKELKAFAKVALGPGETKTATLSVPAADLCYWDIAGNGWKLEPGDYQALVGPSSRSEDLLEAGFKV